MGREGKGVGVQAPGASSPAPASRPGTFGVCCWRAPGAPGPGSGRLPSGSAAAGERGLLGGVEPGGPGSHIPNREGHRTAVLTPSQVLPGAQLPGTGVLFSQGRPLPRLRSHPQTGVPALPGRPAPTPQPPRTRTQAPTETTTATDGAESTPLQKQGPAWSSSEGPRGAARPRPASCDCPPLGLGHRWERGCPEGSGRGGDSHPPASGPAPPTGSAPPRQPGHRAAAPVGEWRRGDEGVGASSPPTSPKGEGE